MQHDDFYKRVRRQVHTWVEEKGSGHKYAEFILVAPDLVHLLVRMTLDDRVDTKSKARANSFTV